MRLWNGTDHGGRGTLTGGKLGTLGQVNCVGGPDDTRDTERRLRDGQDEVDASGGSIVGDAELERSRGILGDVAEGEVLASIVLDPAGRIGRLELDQGNRSRSGGACNGEGLATAVRVDCEVGTEASSHRRVEVDVYSDGAVGVDCGGNVAQSELSDGESVSLVVPCGERTLSASRRELDVSDGQRNVALVGDDDSLFEGTVGSSNDALESDSWGRNGQQRTGALASAGQSDMSILTVTSNSIGGIDKEIGRDQANGGGLEGDGDVESLAGGEGERQGSSVGDDEIVRLIQANICNSDADQSLAGDRARHTLVADVDSTEIVGGSAVHRHVYGGAEGIEVTESGALVHDAITKDSPAELG